MPVTVEEVCIVTRDMLCVRMRDPVPTLRGIEQLPTPQPLNRGTMQTYTSAQYGAGTVGRVIGPGGTHSRVTDVFAADADMLDRTAAEDFANYGTVGGLTVTAAYLKAWYPYIHVLASNAEMRVLYEFELYLKLSGNLAEGNHTITFPAGVEVSPHNFTYSFRTTRCVAIGVDQNGYRPRDDKNIAVVSCYVPKFGPINYASLGITAWQLVDAHGAVHLEGTMTQRVTPTTPETGVGTTVNHVGPDKSSATADGLMAYPDEMTKVAVTSIAAGTPPVITTAAAHGLSNGQDFWLLEPNGTPVSHANLFRIQLQAKNVTSTTVEVQQYTGSPGTLSDFNGSAFTAWAGSTNLYRGTRANRARTYTYDIDLSGVATLGLCGIFRLKIPNLGVSDPFRIDEAVYYKGLKKAADSLAAMRTGITHNGSRGWTAPIAMKPGTNGFQVKETKVPYGLHAESAGSGAVSLADAGCLMLNYDTRTGSQFAVNRTLTGGTSGATAIIHSAPTTGTSGKLYLVHWNGTHYVDNETITDGAGASALANGASWTFMTNTDIPDAWGGWRDAGDFDRRRDGFAVCHWLMMIYEMLPPSGRKISYGAERLSDILPDPMYLGMVVPDILVDVIWYMDLYRRTQRADGGCSGNLEQIHTGDNFEPGWYFRYGLATGTSPNGGAYLSLPDHAATYNCAGEFAWLSILLRDLGYTTVADVWLEAAFRAWRWAERIAAIGKEWPPYREVQTIAGWNETTYTNNYNVTLNTNLVPTTEGFSIKSLPVATLYRATGDTTFLSHLETFAAGFGNVLTGYRCAFIWNYTRCDHPITHRTVNTANRNARKGNFASQAETNWMDVNYDQPPSSPPTASVSYIQDKLGGAFPQFGGLGNNLPMPLFPAEYWTPNARFKPYLRNCISFSYGVNQNKRAQWSNVGVRSYTGALFIDSIADRPYDAPWIPLYGYCTWTLALVSFSIWPSFGGISEIVTARRLEPAYLSMPYFEATTNYPLVINHMEFTVQQGHGPMLASLAFFHGWDGNICTEYQTSRFRMYGRA